METCVSTYWPSQGFPPYSSSSRTRTVDIEEQKQPLPLTISQYSIERFNSGENALPMGLLPPPVHAYQGLNATAMPGLTFSQMDHDEESYHSSILEDDQCSLSTGSSASGPGAPPTWSQGSPNMSSYRSNSIPMAYQDTALSPSDSNYALKSSEVIDPSLTLNYQDPDMYGYKPEPPIKFEFPCFPGNDAEYEHESYSPDSTTCVDYYHYKQSVAAHQQAICNYNDGCNWGVRKVPVTRSQAQNESRTQSQSSKSSTRGSKSHPRSPLSPTTKKRIERQRRGSGSSSSEDQSHRTSNRPKTYKKKIPFHYCEEETCKSGRVCFKNRSELKKHIETQHTKPYICIFGFAGCQQRFGARNEWKRHIATQHLVLYKYICDHPECVEKNKAKTIFNRGDLFMKHQERMHSPANIYDRNHDDLELIAWKKTMKDAKMRCETLRSPPQRMTCGFCNDVFEHGDKTWQELIDHVGLHYQANDETVRNSNGYRDDQDLMAWMKQHNLIKREEDSMDVDSETPTSRGSRKYSYASSSESSSAKQIKQEQADAF